MSNPARAKGTRFENEILLHLQQIWPGADRAKSGNFSNDYHGVPIPIEAKFRKRWDILEWVGKLKTAAGGHKWALMLASGDRRISGKNATLMIVDVDFGMELLGCWERSQNGLSAD